MKRECFPCTACCEGWLRATIGKQRISPGTPCLHCRAEGCAIYERRPVNPCQEFTCAWLHPASPLPDYMKPSECGAIIVLRASWKIHSDAEKSWTVLEVFPTGDEMTQMAHQWLTGYARRSNTPLIFHEFEWEDGEYKGSRRKGYGPASFIEAVKSSSFPEDIDELGSEPD